MPAQSHRILPRMGGRWLPVAVAAYTALLCVAVQAANHRDTPDFLVFWTAGRALLHNQSPYAAVQALGTGYPYFYPVAAALLFVPFALIPWHVAWVIWIAGSAGLLTLAGQRQGRGLVCAVLSAAFLNAVAEGTFTPLLVAAAVLPALGPLLAVKPSIGAALWAWRPNRWAVLGGAALLAVGFAIGPQWTREWLASLHAAHHVAPVLRPGGVLLLLALLRWRTPEGRLLALLAVVPQSAALYETLPLFLIPATRREGYLLAVLSFLAAGIMELTVSGTSLGARAALAWPALLWCCYVPALALLLSRPNRAPEPGPVAEQPVVT